MAHKYEMRERVDELITHFWRNGYLTLSRKFGKYLPEPKPIGGYSVDAIGKFKKKYVIGLILNENDIKDPQTVAKLNFLATRNTQNREVRVTLFLGIPAKMIYEASLLIDKTVPEAKNNIKIIPLPN
ncbi:MAG TPA: hypothetical protein PL041_08625 [Melioribacteraceae bacterium]|nr:hypothetical protein [Melioribacteraceae bacterium]